MGSVVEIRNLHSTNDLNDVKCSGGYHLEGRFNPYTPNHYSSQKWWADPWGFYGGRIGWIQL